MRTAVIFWGHGHGWRGMGSMGPTRAPRLGWSLSDGALERALAQLTAGLGQKLDLLGFDACLMGSWEVATTVAAYSNVIVASAELVPAAGWPLTSVLARLEHDTALTGSQLAAEIAQQFRDTSRHHNSLTILDASRVPALDAALEGLARAALSSRCELRGEWLSDALRYRASDVVDLEGLAEAVERQGCSRSVRTRAAQLRAALASARLGMACRDKYCESGGLSIHVPLERFDYTYLDAAAAWNRHTQWAKWLEVSSPIDRSGDTRHAGR